jgi:hypothetical protein
MVGSLQGHRYVESASNHARRATLPRGLLLMDTVAAQGGCLCGGVRYRTTSALRSSDSAERGFCERCGGNLFWRLISAGSGTTSIMAGTVDPPTGLRIIQHIFTADKSDYYEINDGAPQSAQWPG